MHASSRGNKLCFPEGTHTYMRLAGGRRLGAAIKMTLYHCKAMPLSPLCLLNVTLSHPACHVIRILTFLRLISLSVLAAFVREDAENAAWLLKSRRLWLIVVGRSVIVTTSAPELAEFYHHYMASNHLHNYSSSSEFAESHQFLY